MLWLMLTITFWLLIAFSRIYLRVHTFNQVVFGLLLGLWISISYHFVVRHRYLKLLNRIANGRFTRDDQKICLIFSSLLLLTSLVT